MADEMKEQKLAAARRKLRKYQLKKEERSKVSLSRESTPDINDDQLIRNWKSGESTKSSSVDDVNEAVTNEIKISQPSAGLGSMDQCQSSNENINYFSRTNNEKEYTTNEALVTNILEADSSMSDDQDGSVSSETNVSMSTVIQVKPNVSQPANLEPIAKSTTESLRQLSLQMSGLVNGDEEIDSSGRQFAILELENRNSELAAMLSNEKQLNAQQAQLIEELRTRLSMQDSQIQTLQSMAMAGNNNVEVLGLREQLQVHIQTIGILVAEKSDLQSSLANTRHSFEQKSGEVTELQGRLDASRQHIQELESSVQKLERESSSLSSSRENDVQQLGLLQSSHSKLNKLCDEMRSSVAELSERLTVKSEENQKLNLEITEIRKDLELAQIHIHQLNTGSQEDLHAQLRQLQVAFQESQNQIMLSKEASKQVFEERTQLEEQYKAYVEELSAEMQELKDKLFSEEQQRQEILKGKFELEEKLKIEEMKSTQEAASVDFEAEKSSLQSTIEKYKEDATNLEERCASLMRDNGQLSQLLSEQSSRLDAMENAADRNSVNKVDTAQLLQSMQSDKIAAARALTQNKQLKEQLEELQNGFIMMSNKKLELTEKLEKELHIKKAIHQEAAKLAEEIASQKQEILELKREIEKLRSFLQSPYSHAENKRSLNGQVLTTEESKSHTKHQQLMQNDDFAATVSPQRENETKLLNGFAKSAPELEEGTAENENSTGHSIDREEERTAEQNQDDAPLKICNPEFSEVSIQMAHEALEKRFLKCMQDLVAVSDEKQRLEHLVQQLQIETETVGDYITIYQFQRGVMKQHMQEMKSELELMKIEKEETISRFSKLQELFSSLAVDECVQKGVLSGIKNIFDSSSSTKEGQTESQSNLENNADSVSVNELTDSPQQKGAEPKRNNKETVKQIINLISEMETSNQLDFTALHKFHPCSHCSGKLITI